MDQLFCKKDIRTIWIILKCFWMALSKQVIDVFDIIDLYRWHEDHIKRMFLSFTRFISRENFLPTLDSVDGAIELLDGILRRITLHLLKKILVVMTLTLKNQKNQRVR